MRAPHPALSLVLALAACSGAEPAAGRGDVAEVAPPAPPSASAALSSWASARPGPVVDEAAAIAAFKAGWQAVGLAAPDDEKAFATEIGRAMHTKELPIVAKKLACVEAVANTTRWMSTLSHDFMLSGSLQASRVQGDCWEVTFSGGMKLEAQAILSDPALKILATWRIPEGLTMVALSVLDLSPIAAGSTAGETLWRSVDLAEHAEALGFARYWVAEHHNAGAVASSAPEILIGQIAARTRAMRVGAGGIMLPNHSPLKVAELFRVLSAMFPGRIDLGLGRAAGTDPRTAAELRRGKPLVDPDEMAGELDRLEGFLLADPPARGPFSRSIAAIPMGVAPPDVWLLGSSDYSSALAARRGLPFAFAAHMSPGDAEAELRKYRVTFQPSARHAAPTSIVSLAVICAPTSEEARRLAASAELGWLHFAQGLRDLPMPSEEEAGAHVDDPDQAAIRELFRERLIVGAPAEVAERVMAIRRACQADEVMLMTHVHDHEARRRSYALIAEALGLDKKVAPPARAVR